ncbi:MAG TPA: DUF2155 domain-containing protein [Xanthobacteraceae bacterium]
MVRLLFAAALLPVALALGCLDARAQPRPPAGVPNGNRLPVPADPQPAPNYPPPSGGRVAPPGAVQSQPLPPPPGVAAAEPSAQGQPTLSGLPPAGLPPGGSPRQPPRGAPPPPVDASAQPGDQIVAEPPSQKIVNNGALFSGLDKITGRIINFDVAIGETVQFGALQVTPRACYTRPATETQNTDAFVEVDEVTLQGEVKRVFTGWMFASSPGLHGIEHAIYDVWLTNCKGPAQTVSATPDPPPAPTRTQPQTPRNQQPPQQRRPPPPQAPR